MSGLSKDVLLELAEALGIESPLNMTLRRLEIAIKSHSDFDEEWFQGSLERIELARVAKEKEKS